MTGREKLCEALAVIKLVCSFHSYCEFCPMSDYSSCILAQPELIPEDWEIEYDCGSKVLKGYDQEC